MSSADISQHHGQLLLKLAEESIHYGLENEQRLVVNPDDFPAPLFAQRAAFVTLTQKGQLRGCIGHLTATQSLAEDVAENAYSAAFNDYRFSPLTAKEWPDLEISISILSPPEPISFTSESDLLSKIRPGIDGLILELDQNRGTFLPSVWESLPTPEAFLQALKQKAGLPGNFWSNEIHMSRYTTQQIKG